MKKILEVTAATLVAVNLFYISFGLPRDSSFASSLMEPRKGFLEFIFFMPLCLGAMLVHAFRSTIPALVNGIVPHPAVPAVLLSLFALYFYASLRAIKAAPDFTKGIKALKLHPKTTAAFGAVSAVLACYWLIFAFTIVDHIQHIQSVVTTLVVFFAIFVAAMVIWVPYGPPIFLTFFWLFLALAPLIVTGKPQSWFSILQTLNSKFADKIPESSWFPRAKFSFWVSLIPLFTFFPSRSDFTKGGWKSVLTILLSIIYIPSMYFLFG